MKIKNKRWFVRGLPVFLTGWLSCTDQDEQKPVPGDKLTPNNPPKIEPAPPPKIDFPRFIFRFGF